MRVARSKLVVVWIVLFLGSCLALAAEPSRRSILVLDQSEAKSAFYNAVFFGLRSTVSKASGEPVNIYIETFDLARFKSELYEASLKSHLRTKYADRQPGVIVTVGGEALKMALRWRAELWPNVPLVFSLVGEQTIARLKPGPDVTGSLVRLRFEDMMTAARAVVPDLTQLALVGDAWDTQTVYGDLKDEIPAATDGVAIIDLVGLPMSELRTRVAALPPRTAIAYTGIYSDGHDTFYSPLEALGLFAEVANAPIVGTAETFVGPGAIGGFVMMPARIGQEAAQLALRIL
ncbi:MAG: histidine kinase, partial [Hyphomicrobiales bacterium]|nr:histidine kinase [Hyphomicrobiales bacterium]